MPEDPEVLQAATELQLLSVRRPGLLPLDAVTDFVRLAHLEAAAAGNPCTPLSLLRDWQRVPWKAGEALHRHLALLHLPLRPASQGSKEEAVRRKEALASLFENHKRVQRAA